jgi:cytidylate kinase
MLRIAIDGPGGAGKSSVAKAVAKELGIIYVDTGALYRTIALHMTNKGITTDNKDAIISELGNFTLEVKFADNRQVILLNGEDVGDSIRTSEISMAASAISAIKEVRDFLLNTQRNIARENSVIMDGRDIGTVILPYAEVKIFLTASPEARAKRRYDELIARGQDVTYEKVFAEMAERDKNDSTRAIAPCVQAEDAILLDNSKLNAEQTVKAVIKIIKKKQKCFYMKMYKLLAPPIRFFQRIKAVGIENIPLDHPYMICSNHIAAKDVIMIGAVYPQPIRFIAKKELFSIPILGWIIKKMGAIKLDRSGTDVAAIKTSVNLAKAGQNIAIFPQGHRYPAVDPSTTQTKNGAALIAYKSGADILPVFIKTKGNKYRFLHRIEIVFGKPIKNSELGFTSGGSEEYKAATDKIFAQILSLGGYSALAAPKDKENTD